MEGASERSWRRRRRVTNHRMKRVIVLSNHVRVSTSLGQLHIEKEEVQHQVPIEDLAMVVVEHPTTTISGVALRELAAANVVCMICDEKHHPIALQLPLAGHSEHSKRAQKQIAMSLPLKKQLWRQIVVAKIGNQAQLLSQHHLPTAARKLRTLARDVKSGDSENREAVAAQHYWQNFVPGGLRRAAGFDPPNQLLNYGYAIVRASMARALVASGLLPVLGLNHHNKYNAFCLADDMMEPYRPFVDSVCLSILNQGGGRQEELSKEERQLMLETLQTDSIDAEGETTSPLAVAMERSAQSLVQCIFQEKKQLFFPQLV